MRTFWDSNSKETMNHKLEVECLLLMLNLEFLLIRSAAESKFKEFLLLTVLVANQVRFESSGNGMCSYTCTHPLRSSDLGF